MMFGCNKKSVHIIDMILFRFQPPNIAGLIKRRVTQRSINIDIKTIGKNMVKNALNISFDGANSLISVSSTNQSNDKNASDDAPTISIDPNISPKPSGNFKLNE